MTSAAAFKADPETLAEATWPAMLYLGLGLNLGQSQSEAQLRMKFQRKERQPRSEDRQIPNGNTENLDPAVPEATTFLYFPSWVSV